MYYLFSSDSDEHFYLGHFSKVDQTISVPSLDIHLQRVDLVKIGSNVWQCTGLLAREKKKMDGY